jgi:hypothetical protein
VCRSRLPLLLVVFAAITGCSNSELVPLSGKVTLDGAPLPTAIITFMNVSNGPSGYGSVQENGSYFAKTGGQSGLKPGDYQISVVAYQPEEVIDRTRAKNPKVITLERYANPQTSGFNHTLGPSGGTFDIELTSK